MGAATLMAQLSNSISDFGVKITPFIGSIKPQPVTIAYLPERRG